MFALPLKRSLVLLALGFLPQAAAVCTRSVIAKQGDTCASLAAGAGITVTQFLRSNPSVTSCSQLVVGGSYCVEGTADSAPTATSSAPPVSTSPSELPVSTDGSCGQGVTCAGSRFGSCCSMHGFCGSTNDYCGDGCQPAFGSCGNGVSTSSPAVSVTVTVTTVTAITRTSLVYQTSTITNVVTQTQTAATTTVTQTVRTTATISATVTATATSTSIIRLTTILTSVAVSTSITTSTAIDTITTIVTSTQVVTGTACSTQPAKPSPTLPGTPNNCKKFDRIRDDDSCRSLATRNGLTLLEFYNLNPSINCDELWEDYYVCIGR